MMSLSRFLACIFFGGAYAPMPTMLDDCKGIQSGINWKSMKRELLKFIDAPQNGFPGDFSQLTLAAEDPYNECPVGSTSARIVTSMLNAETQDEMWEAITNQWNSFLGEAPWVQLIQTGWPIFQLLSFRAKLLRAGRKWEPHLCMSGESYEHSADQYVLRAVRYATFESNEAGAKPTFVSSVEAFAIDGGPRSPWLRSAVFLLAAFSKFPVYDDSTIMFLDMAQEAAPIQVSIDLVQFLAAPAVLPLLEQISRNYHALLVDSGALYSADTDDQDGDEPSLENEVDYTRHMMEDEPNFGECVVQKATTPSGRCSPFMVLASDLAPWQSRKVTKQATAQAYRQVYDQKTFAMRVLPGKVQLVLPDFGHYDAEANLDKRSEEPFCIVGAVLNVLRQGIIKPGVEIVLSHGDLPSIRLQRDSPPFYSFNDRELRVPSPVFSICGSDVFGDILFPNVCRPALVNLTQKAEHVDWDEKYEKAFWRGTDRGGINWVPNYQRLLVDGSPRKRLLDSVSGDILDGAFLDDDLMNSSVVANDPNFVPMDQSLRWKYLLDLPGNGYSGALKQKLTGSSAVILPTEPLPPAPQDKKLQVYEHYMAGLRSWEHIIPFKTAEDLEKRVEWARRHDDTVLGIKNRANQYMEDFKMMSECYIYRLLSSWQEVLDYEVSADASHFENSTVTEFAFLPPLPKQAAKFEKMCDDFILKDSQ